MSKSIFIWEEVYECSGREHSNGGVCVVAGDEQAARALANKEPGCNISEDEKVTVQYELSGDQDDRVFIFPDAGCC